MFGCIIIVGGITLSSRFDTLSEKSLSPLSHSLSLSLSPSLHTPCTHNIKHTINTPVHTMYVHATVTRSPVNHHADLSGTYGMAYSDMTHHTTLKTMQQWEQFAEAFWPTDERCLTWNQR